MGLRAKPLGRGGKGEVEVVNKIRVDGWVAGCVAWGVGGWGGGGGGDFPQNPQRKTAPIPENHVAPSYIYLNIRFHFFFTLHTPQSDQKAYAEKSS